MRERRERKPRPVMVAGAPYQSPLSDEVRAENARRREADEPKRTPLASDAAARLQAARDARHAARLAETREAYGRAALPSEPPKPKHGRKVASKRLQTMRTDRGTFAPDDVESLMLSALADAERWQEYVTRPGYAGECANKPANARKRKASGGREVSLEERNGFAPATFHADPPETMSRLDYRPGAVGGMATAQCLGCGEMLRRKPDSDRPCPFCKGKFFAWQCRETDTWIGDDYSLPAHWYGDLTGVSAHYLAVERVKDEPTDVGGGQSGRSSQPVRLIPTGPDGTMRWLTVQRVKVGPKRGRKSKAVVAYFAPVSDATLFADATSAYVQNQRID